LGMHPLYHSHNQALSNVTTRLDDLVGLCCLMMAISMGIKEYETKFNDRPPSLATLLVDPTINEFYRGVQDVQDVQDVDGNALQIQ